jgi:hypothetical protein
MFSRILLPTTPRPHRETERDYFIRIAEERRRERREERRSRWLRAARIGSGRKG